MCLAIYKKPESILSREALENGYNNNPHGAGFAYAREGKLYVRKGFFDFHDFWAEFNGIQKGNPAIIHFRYANVGDINKENCHPWRIDKNHAMIHNGTFVDFVSDETNLSDSGLYTKLLLKPIFRKFGHFWKTKQGIYLLEKTMGWSKMVVLSNTGDFLICRSEAGLWEDGCWFSNDGFKSESEYAGTCFPRQLFLDLKFENKDSDESNEHAAEFIEET